MTLPLEYEEHRAPLSPASSNSTPTLSIPPHAVLISLPDNPPMFTAHELGGNVCAGVESVVLGGGGVGGGSHRPLGEGQVFIHRVKPTLPLPPQMTLVGRENLHPKLQATLLHVNHYEDEGEGNKGRVDLNVEVVALQPHYSLPEGVSLVAGCVTVQPPACLSLPSHVQCIYLHDERSDVLDQLALKHVYEVPIPFCPSIHHPLLRGQTSSSLNSQHPQWVNDIVPPHIKFVLLPDSFEVHAWGEGLPGVRAVSLHPVPPLSTPRTAALEESKKEKDSDSDGGVVALPALSAPQAIVNPAPVALDSLRNVPLPPFHFFIERVGAGAGTKEGELPATFQLGLHPQYAHMALPPLPPQVEVMHVKPLYPLPSSVQIINTSVLARGVFNNLAGSSYTGGGCMYAKRSFDPFWLPSLPLLEGVGKGLVALPWPREVCFCYDALEQIDALLFREPHCLLYVSSTEIQEEIRRSGKGAAGVLPHIPAVLSPHPSSQDIVSLLFKTRLHSFVHKEGGAPGDETQILRFLDPDLDLDLVSSPSIRDFIVVVRASRGFVPLQDRLKSAILEKDTAETATRSNPGGVTEPPPITLYPTITRMARMDFDPSLHVDSLLAELSVFRLDCGFNNYVVTERLRVNNYNLVKEGLNRLIGNNEVLVKEREAWHERYLDVSSRYNRLEQRYLQLGAYYSSMRREMQREEDLLAVIDKLKGKIEDMSSKI
eukprot:gene39770-48420_t